jgi:hypothetical protein
VQTKGRDNFDTGSTADLKLRKPEAKVLTFTVVQEEEE